MCPFKVLNRIFSNIMYITRVKATLTTGMFIEFVQQGLRVQRRTTRNCPSIPGSNKKVSVEERKI